MYSNIGHLVYTEDELVPEYQWDNANSECSDGVIWAGDMNGDQQADFVCYSLNNSTEPELVLSGLPVSRISLAELNYSHGLDLSSGHLQVQRVRWKSHRDHEYGLASGNQLLLSAGLSTVYLGLTSGQNLAIESTQSRSNANNYDINIIASGIRDMNHDGNPDLIYIEDLKHSQGGEDTSAFRILYNGSSSLTFTSS